MPVAPASPEPLAGLCFDASRGDPFDLAHLSGRLIELSGQGATSRLSFAFSLVHTVQRHGAPAAWITHTSSVFFPPDVARCGVDLSALAVVRLDAPEALFHAADQLLRSGSFGLVALDLCALTDSAFSLSAQSRLASLARRHDTIALCLTEKFSEAPSLGPLVSLHLSASRNPVESDNTARCALHALKDKHHRPGWATEVIHHAPPGVR